MLHFELVQLRKYKWQTYSIYSSSIIQGKQNIRFSLDCFHNVICFLLYVRNYCNLEWNNISWLSSFIWFPSYEMCKWAKSLGSRKRRQHLVSCARRHPVTHTLLAHCSHLPPPKHFWRLCRNLFPSLSTNHHFICACIQNICLYWITLHVYVTCTSITISFTPSIAPNIKS